jgi:hypothetical protein
VRAAVAILMLAFFLNIPPWWIAGLGFSHMTYIRQRELRTNPQVLKSVFLLAYLQWALTDH